MKRGDIIYADLGPTVGSEINKRRPVLIVKERITGTPLGRLAADKLREVDAAIRLHLAL
jgi:mRNA interferase MazF